MVTQFSEFSLKHSCMNWHLQAAYTGVEVWRWGCKPADSGSYHIFSFLLSHTQRSLINWLLKLACACLSFDFIGTSTDESGDDLTTVQIPTSWRSTFLEYSTMQLFFNLFHSLSSELAAMVRLLWVEPGFHCSGNSQLCHSWYCDVVT